MTKIAEIEARLKAATPGPWEAVGNDAMHSQYLGDWWIQAGDVGDVVCDMDGLQRSKNEQVAQDDGEHDAYFIANAPTDMAYLLDLVKRHQRALQFVCDELSMADAFDRPVDDERIMKAIHAEMEGVEE